MSDSFLMNCLPSVFSWVLVPSERVAEDDGADGAFSGYLGQLLSLQRTPFGKLS